MVDAAPRKVQDRYFESNPDAAASQSKYRLRRECIRTGDTQFRRRRLEDILGANSGGPDGRFAREPHHGRRDYAEFMSLVQAMLVYDPVRRIRAAEGLQHPFITMSYRAAAPAAVTTAASAEGSRVPSPAVPPQPGQAQPTPPAASSATTALARSSGVAPSTAPLGTR